MRDANSRLARGHQVMPKPGKFSCTCCGIELPSICLVFEAVQQNN